MQAAEVHLPVNLYGSILFLTCIGQHRYSGVVYQLKSLGELRKRGLY